MRKGKQRGISIIVTLMVLTIIMIIVFAVGAQGIWNLNFVNREKYSKMATYAAEASLAVPIVGFKKGYTGWATCSSSFNNPNIYDQVEGIGNYFEVTDNSAGSSDATASNGVVVKPGMVYFLGHGLAMNKTIHKTVGVMVDAGNNNSFTYAIASAGPVQLKNSNVYGSIKIDGNISFNANVDVYPSNHLGRVLCGASILNGNNWLRLHGDSANNDQYDCRARTSITGTNKVSSASSKVAPDTSTATQQFINDGSITPALNAGQSGEKLPNPDPATLFQTYTVHRNATHTSFTYSGTLGPGVHYFPDGLTFTGSISSTCTATAPCTIVAGRTKGMTIPASTDPVCPAGSAETSALPGVITYNSNAGSAVVNLVALDGGSSDESPAVPWDNNGTVGGASITLPNQCTINGLVYCHGQVQTQGQFTSVGSLITYYRSPSLTSQVHDGAQANFTFNKDNLKNVPGFEKWFKIGGAGSGTVTVLSTQRF